MIRTILNTLLTIIILILVTIVIVGNIFVAHRLGTIESIVIIGTIIASVIVLRMK